VDSNLCSALVDPEKIGVLLIDAQPAFLDSMHGPKEPLLARLERLLLLVDVLNLPMIATFEHPVEKKGWLPNRLEKVFPANAKKYVKKTFNVCLDGSIKQAIRRLSVKQIVLAGGETDVCVMQSALGLVGLGFQVFLLEDSIFTSEAHPRPALNRMYNAGVIPCTFKSLFYELFRTVDEALPKEIRRRIDSLPRGFRDVEELPQWKPE
jgi:isochorismate hydrolase